jgi:hypothetical protein
MRKLITIACTLAAIALPPVAGAGAIQMVETWTNEPTGLFYNGEFCGGRTVAGYGTESGMARITETSNGGVHVRGHAEGTIPLYLATGPPWAVEFGDFLGTWNYSVSFDEQVAAGGQGSLGSVAGGRIEYADGSSQYFQVIFRLVLQQDGPPKLFLVKIICGRTK